MVLICIKKLRKRNEIADVHTLAADVLHLTSDGAVGHVAPQISVVDAEHAGQARRAPRMSPTMINCLKTTTL